MTSGTYSPAEYEFMLRKYQSDLSVAKKTISTLQSELATARLNAKCPCCENGVTVEGLQCPECKGKGLAVIAYEHPALTAEIERLQTLNESLTAELAAYEEKFDIVKNELMADANFGELVRALWDKPAIEFKMEISKLERELATARESEKHSIEFIQRDNDLDAKIRNEALESAALWFENPLNGYAMNGSIIAEHIRSLKPQPLNTNIASAPEGSGA